MALVCGLIRMTFLGIPPLALTGAVWRVFAGLFYQWGKLGWSMLGKFWDRHHWLVIVLSCNGFGLLAVSRIFIGSFIPRFIGATLIGSVIAWLVL